MKQICLEARKLDLKIKISSRGGKKLKHDAKSNPLGKSLCTYKNCFPCGTETESNKAKQVKSQCRGMGAAYAIHCITCKKLFNKTVIYEGESGASGRKHERLWRSKNDKSVMHMHDIMHHNGQKAEYRMEIIRKYKSAFERQSNEPMRIKLDIKSKYKTNINSKTEWNSQSIERLRAIPVGGNNANSITDNNTNLGINLIQPSNTINIRKPG